MPLPDFLLIAAVGRVLRWLQLDGANLSTENLAACCRVGRGDVEKPATVQRAVQAAVTFWLYLMFVSLGLGLAFMVVVAVVFGHTSLSDPLPSCIFGVLTGVTAWAGLQFAFAMHSYQHLRLGRLGRPRPQPIEPWALAAGTPRLRASVISLLVGIAVAAAAIQRLLE